MCICFTENSDQVGAIVVWFMSRKYSGFFPRKMSYKIASFVKNPRQQITKFLTFLSTRRAEKTIKNKTRHPLRISPEALKVTINFILELRHNLFVN